MCRPKQLQGWCAFFFGLGLMVGYFLDSWFLCVCGGTVLLLLGLILSGKRG